VQTIGVLLTVALEQGVTSSLHNKLNFHVQHMLCEHHSGQKSSDHSLSTHWFCLGFKIFVSVYWHKFFEVCHARSLLHISGHLDRKRSNVRWLWHQSIKIASYWI